MTDKFVHFRTQSSYSMLESAIKVNQLTELAKSHNMSAVCLADRGNLFASLEFALSAVKSGVQPIHGAILNLAFTGDKGKDDFAEILLIAKDEIGYKNLLKLVSYSFIKNDRKVCEYITFSDLEQYSEGIIALSAYDQGIIGKSLLAKSADRAVFFAQKLQKIFGDRFYFEIMRRDLQIEKQIENKYLKIAKDLGIPLIATNQVLFSNVEMHDAHDVLLCISQGVVREQQDRIKVSNSCYFKSGKEMAELFSDLPEAIENTVNLAQRCYVMAETHPPSLPNFSDGLSSEEELIRQESKSGLEARLSVKFEKEQTSPDQQQEIKKEYFDRLSYELDIICKMQFAGYFLIVSDFIKWSKQNNIAVGPGRGSGAGSIIAWVLEITDVDPIKFGLLFERFLNPERVSMPDFDIDFCQEGREDVINYVRSKYGDGRVGQIITFGKMQAKAVIKDVSRVLGLRYQYADYLTELVPFNAINPVTLSQAINDVAELRDAANGKGLYNLDGENELISQVISTALTLEGLHRHSSTHAAGVVVANQEMIDIVPVCKDVNSDMLIVQYSMKYCELGGLVKFDFLGLQTLTVITKCLALLEKQGTKIDMERLSFDDEKTFAMLSSGMSTGVFQFESTGMKSALRRLRPDNIEDIIALGALYRPGPMDNIPTYIACKSGKQKPDYLHKLLEPILKTTHGVIIYQEQVMEIARRLAGYSLGAADLLRRAMGKKVKAEMDAQEEIFISGAKKNKVSEQQAKSIFATVAKFAGYGFNKSHATAYGIISYQTAYLKANFPTEFLVASLNLDIDSSDKIVTFLQEAKNFNIPVIPPCVNLSKGLFDISNNDGEKSIVFPIGAIKNIALSFGDVIAKERQARGNFKSIIDFIERVDSKLINKRLLENMIKAGCFDKLHSNRASLLASVSKLLAYCTSYHAEQKSSQFSLIKVNANRNDVLIETENFGNTEYAFLELEVMGLFMHYHPLSEYSDILAKSVKNLSDVKDLSDGTHQISLAGVIIKKDARMSQRGRFITLILSGLDGIFEITIFSEDILKNYAHLINVRQSVIVTCEVSKDQGGARITAKSFTTPENILDNIHFDLKLYPKDRKELDNMMSVLVKGLNQDKSNSKIAIFLPTKTGFFAKIDVSDSFYLAKEDINKLGFGETNQVPDS